MHVHLCVVLWLFSSPVSFSSSFSCSSSGPSRCLLPSSTRGSSPKTCATSAWRPWPLQTTRHPSHQGHQSAHCSNVMRFANLSADRIGLHFASEELARAMAEPTKVDVDALKRSFLFLLKYTRSIQSFERQETVHQRITCFSESNFVGCLQSRKSTSSCNIFYGRHLPKSTSITQTVVSLSSTQAEFYAAVRPAVVGICCVSLMRDFDVVLQQQGVEVKAKG